MFAGGGTMPTNNILEIRNLQKSFGRHEVLKDISFNIEQGKIVGLLGKNGSGKTTLIKSVLGLLNYSGEVLYDGKQIDYRDTQAMNSIGVLVDTAFFEDMSAYDNLKILMMSTPHRDNSHMIMDIMELLAFVGLEENSKEKVKGFSFGMKQRLALAQSLTSEPKLLILDEPFVGLDPLGIVIVKEKLLELCKQKNTAVIFSSHQLSEVAELSEVLVAIEDGHVKYFGSYEELARQNKQYYIVLDKIVGQGVLQAIKANGIEVELAEQDNCLRLRHGDQTLDRLLHSLIENELGIKEIIREDKILESLFV